MLSNHDYVVESLELHLFFARIMKEHSIFLEAGFTPKDVNFAREADRFKEDFEELLFEVVTLSQGIVSKSVLMSGEIVTDFTLDAEKITQDYTGISIDSNITLKELELRSRKTRMYNF